MLQPLAPDWQGIRTALPPEAAGSSAMVVPKSHAARSCEFRCRFKPDRLGRGGGGQGSGPQQKADADEDGTESSHIYHLSLSVIRE